jgi:hypothetical protein
MTSKINLIILIASDTFLDYLLMFNSLLGWHPQTDINLNVIGAFPELRQCVNDGTCDVFLWEYFTTKPFVDNGVCLLLDN